MKKLTLTDLTLNTILEALQNVMQKSSFCRYKIVDGKEILLRDDLPATVKVHPFYGKSAKALAILGGEDTTKPMILVQFAGTSVMICREGDEFEWDTDSEIKITAYNYGLDNKTFVFKMKRFSPTKKQIQRLNRTKQSNELSKQYWDSIADSLERELERDFDDICR